MCMIGLQGWIWNTYGPIALTVESPDVFNWDDSNIAWMANWGAVTYILTCLPYAWLLDNLGLR